MNDTMEDSNTSATSVATMSGSSASASAASGGGAIFCTGYSLRAPESDTPFEFYENLRTKTDMTTPSRRYPPGKFGLPPRTGTLKTIDRFDHEFFHFSTKQVEKMDICIRLLLEVTQEALMDAKISIDHELAGSNTGVYVGHCFSDYLNRSTHDEHPLTGYELVHGAHTMAANKISFHYDLKGPSLAVDTACSSSLVALHQAVADLESGRIDRAIVGGLSLNLDPSKNAAFNAFTMLSPTGYCYTFDERANGYCRAEGIACVILEREGLGPCEKKLFGYCRVLGTAVNSDGHKDKGITYPSAEAQAGNARRCFLRNNVDPASITYVEAHGTGTVAGDHKELQGLSRVFYGTRIVSKEDAAKGGKVEDPKGPSSDCDIETTTKPYRRELKIGSVKSNMGHAEGASGLMSMIKCMLMYEHKQLLPNLHFQSTAHAPLLDGRFSVVSDLEDWENMDNCCISNYGFGGTNAFVILGPGNLEPISSDNKSPLGQATSPFFANAPPPKNDNTAEKSCTNGGGGRENFFLEQLTLGNDRPYRYKNGKKTTAGSSASAVAFVYGGQGSQWNNMGKVLMQESTIFKETIERLDGYLLDHLEEENIPVGWTREQRSETYSLVRLYKGGDKWLDRRFTVLGIVSYQIAVTNILKAAGIRPDFYLGHSLGEVAAGYAGVGWAEEGGAAQSERETIQVAFVRSALSEKIRKRSHILKTKLDLSSEGVEKVHYAMDSEGFSYYYLHNEKDALLLEEAKGRIKAERKGTSNSSETLFDMTGKMAAVGLPVKVIEEAIRALGLRETCVACHNSPNGQTVSGAEQEVERLHELLFHEFLLEDEKLFWRTIPTDGVAYHAPHLSCHTEYLKSQFDKILRKSNASVTRGPLDKRWLSTSRGSTLDGYYHANNITKPVYFQEAIERLPKNCLVVEIGSSAALLSQIKRTSQEKGLDLILLGLVTAKDPKTELDSFRTPDKAAEKFWMHGWNRWLDRGRLQRLGLGAAGSGSDKWSLFSGPRRSPDGSGMSSRSSSVGLNLNNVWDEKKSSVDSVAVAEIRNLESWSKGGREMGEKEKVISRPTSATTLQSTFTWPQVDDRFRKTRLELKFRHPNLWNHEKIQRIFDHTDMDMVVRKYVVGANDTGSKGKMAAGAVSPNSASKVIYDLRGKDAYLLDHVINGRSLFPATGHLVTMWDALCGSDKLNFISDGVEFYDFEILQAVVLDKDAEEEEEDQGDAQEDVDSDESEDEEEDSDPGASRVGRVTFGVKEIEGKLSVLYHGDVVARAGWRKKEGLKKNALSNPKKPSAEKPAKSAADEITLNRSEIYNFFSRFGYEYKAEFQMVEKMDLKTLLTDKENIFLPAHLRTSKHLIAYLDNLLQLFLKDNFTDSEAGLCLPTMIRQVTLHPDARNEPQVPRGNDVCLESATSIVQSPSVLMRELITTPAAPRVRQKLEMRRERFLPFPLKSKEGVSVKAELQSLGELIGNELKYETSLSAITQGLVRAGAERADGKDEAVLKALGSYVAKLLHLEPSAENLDPVEEGKKYNVIYVDAADETVGEINSPSSSPGFDWKAEVLNATGEKGCVYPEAAIVVVATEPGTPTPPQSKAYLFLGTYEVQLDESVSVTSLQVYKRYQSQVTALSFIHDWSEVDLTKRQVFVSPGGQGFLKALSLEKDTHNLSILNIDFDVKDTTSLSASTLRYVENRYQKEVRGCVKFASYDAATQSFGQLVSYPDKKSSEKACGSSSKAGVPTKDASDDYNFSLVIEKPGDLSTLQWRVAGNGPEFNTDVVYSSLNFKDVMYSFGKLRLKVPCFGLEFAGFDRSNASKRVMGIGTTSCIAKRTKAALRWEVPEYLSLEEAATIPVVYLTSAYSLFEKARLEKGDSVLIHAGTGGIGHSAIWLCLQKGIKVFTTCSSEEKKQHLMEFFGPHGLEAENIGNSRDASFRELVLRRTNGEGVDCVLNSLSGALLDASLEVVRDYGSFCEIGKYDIQNNTRIGLKALEKNISYHAIDLQAMFDHKTLSKKLQTMLQEMLDKKMVKPLPQKVFSASHVADGLRFLSAGKHRGKVLIGKMSEFDIPKLDTNISLKPAYCTSGVHLITGGLGGFGLELARWLISRGASHVVLTSRTGELKTGWQKFRFQALLPKVSIATVAVEKDFHTCYTFLQKKDAENKSAGGSGLKGVWHVAALLSDAMFDGMTEEKWNKGNDIKINGAINLDRACRELERDNSVRLLLDSFVVFSSVASLYGNAGQTNYAFANNFCERLTNQRVQDGLVGLSVQWGAIGNVGMLADIDVDTTIHTRTVELGIQNIDDSLEALHYLASQDVKGQQGRCTSTVSCFRRAEKKKKTNVSSSQSTGGAGAELSIAMIQEQIAVILGGTAEDYEQNIPLKDYGLDSLSNIEVVNWINSLVRVKVTPSFITGTLTIEGVLQYMQKHLLEGAAGASAGGKAVTTGKSSSKKSGKKAGKKSGKKSGDKEQKQKGAKNQEGGLRKQEPSASAEDSPLSAPPTKAAGAPGLQQDDVVTSDDGLRYRLVELDLVKYFAEKQEEKLANRVPLTPLKQEFQSVQIPATLSPELFEKLKGVVENINANWQSGVLLVEQEEGSEIFNHGAQIDGPADKIPETIANYVDLTRSLMDMKNAVLVVKVNGSTRGGGMLFPAVGDIVVSSSSSTFGLPEIHRGMIPGIVSSALVKRMGWSAVNYYGMTGTPFSAERAHKLGLVHEVMEGDFGSDENLRAWGQLLRRVVQNSEQACFMKKQMAASSGSSSSGSTLQPEAMGTVMGSWFDKRDSEASSSESEEVKTAHQKLEKLAFTCLKLEELDIKGSEKKKIAVLTMTDKARRNTFSPEMNDELLRLVNGPLKTEGYQALVLASSIPGVFHAGANPHDMRRWVAEKAPRTTIAHRMKNLYASFLELFSIETLPVISVLNGRVYGGGIPIALWSDYRIGTKDLDFHYGNITRGMSPAAQLSQLWGEYLPQGKILEFYLQNAHWGGVKCQKEGLVSSLHTTPELALEEALRLATFVGSQEAAGVGRTRKVVRAGLQQQIIDIEAWFIACSVEEGKVFTNIKTQNKSFRSRGVQLPQTTSVAKNDASSQSQSDSVVVIPKPAAPPEEHFGIACIKLAIPPWQVAAEDVEATTNIPSKSKYLQEALGAWDVNEDAISFGMTALHKLIDSILELERHSNKSNGSSEEEVTVANSKLMRQIGRLEVGTESNVDLAKSIKSYLTDLFPMDCRELLGVDNVNACYGGTAALLNTMDWLRANSDAKYGVVVVTDTAIMDKSDMGFQGAGAVAMLVTRSSVWGAATGGSKIPIRIHQSLVPYMRNTQDFLKPRYSNQLSPFLRGQESMAHYIEALEYCTEKMYERHGVGLGTVDFGLVHGGLCRSVTVKAFNEWSKFKWGGKLPRKELLAKYTPGAEHGTYLGGLYAASLYFNMHSLVEHGFVNDPSATKSVLAFSYGSGSTATLFRADIQAVPFGFDVMEETLKHKVPKVSAEFLKSVLINRHTAWKKDMSGVEVPELEGSKTMAGIADKDSEPFRYVLQRFPEGNAKRVYVLRQAGGKKLASSLEMIKLFSSRMALHSTRVGSSVPFPSNGAKKSGFGLRPNMRPHSKLFYTNETLSLEHSKIEEFEGGEAMKNMNMGASKGVNFKSAGQRVDASPSHTVKKPGVDSRPTTQLLYSTGVMNETQTFRPPPHSQSPVSSPSSLLCESKIDAEGGKVLQFMEFYAKNGLALNTARHDVDRNGSNRYVEIDGKQVLFFGSCSYLGLESHPHLIEGARSAAKKYGTQFPSSRAYVCTELYDRLEALLGSIYSQPVLVTPSTMLAHIAALPTLVGDNDVVVLDVQVHATVQNAAQLLKARGVPLKSVPHNDMNSLEKMIERLRNKHEKVWYLADGLYSMHGDEAPFRKVKEFLDKYDNFHFYVDDAHGVGWAGENGSGVARKHMEHHERMVMAISLNKSFGAGGGALVLANEHQKQLVLKCGGPMIFSGPIQPPMLGAACASAEFHLSPELKIRQTMLQRLIARCNYMIERYNLPQLERNESPIFFIAVGRVEMTAEIIKRMMNDGYFFNIAGYPAVPKNRSGLRFMMNASLHSEDVDNFLTLIRKHYKNVLTENGVKEIDVAKNFDIPPFKL